MATPLKESFTSTGSKFFLHQEAMEKLRNGQGMPITSHIMLTDICQHSCAFCSVATREGNSLTMTQIKEYLDQLVPLGLKSVILSGGGNPILYRDKELSKVGVHPMLPARNADFNDAVDFIKSYGLEIGVITNGIPMREYDIEKQGDSGIIVIEKRKSWKTVDPETLDKLTWVRISMSGLDHKENEVFVPDIDPTKTTLGFSYIYHDIYHEPTEPNHLKVSTPEEHVTSGTEVRMGKDRLPELEKQLELYSKCFKPTYLRLLPNCLEPKKIPERCAELGEMAKRMNERLGREVAFVQYKPPQAPSRCFLGYIHPVLNSDGYVYPCDSCVLNAAAGHKFANPWRVCRWDEIGAHYAKPVQSLVDPQKLCPGCVFTASNVILDQVVEGMPTPPPEGQHTHPNFV
jgi:hypothetical protein